MSDVQYVETAVGKNDLLVLQQRRQFFEYDELSWTRLNCLHEFLVSTGRVPYFMTTIPPA